MKRNLLTLLVLAAFCCFNTNVLWAVCDDITVIDPTGPEATTFVLGESSAGDIAATSIPSADDTGATDFTFIITDVANGGGIVTFSEDGSFDFNDDGMGMAYAAGSYCFSAFWYNQSELNTIGGLIGALPASTLQGLVGVDDEGNPLITLEQAEEIQASIPAEPTLNDLIGLLSAFGDPDAIFTVAGVAESIDGILESAGGLIALCYNYSEDVYCVEVEEAASGPANDDCATPTMLFADATGLTYYGPYTNVDATAADTDPVPDCFAEDQFGEEPFVNNSVWFSLMGDGNTYLVTANQACAFGDLTDTYLTDGDSQIAVYTGDCGDLMQVACNEDAGEAVDGNFFSSLSLDTEMGVTYLIMVDGFNVAGGPSTGEFCLSLEPLAACTANLSLAADQATSIDVCSTDDDIVIALDDEATDLGFDAPVNPAVVYWIFSEEPADGAAANTGLGFASSLSAGTVDGMDPFGLGLSCFWVIPAVGDYNEAEDTYAFSDLCLAQAAPVQICFIADGEGECVDACEGTMLALADGTPEMVSLCPGEGISVLYDVANANLGPEEMDPEVSVEVYWAITDVDPMGNPLAVADDNFLGLAPSGPDGDFVFINDETFPAMIYVTGVNLVVVGEDLFLATCQMVTSSVIINSLSADDPACATADPLTVVDGSDSAAISFDDTSYTIFFSVSGGEGAYTSDQGSFSGADFASIEFACGTPFSITVSDESGASVEVSGDAPCDAPLDPLTVVDGSESTSVSADGTSYTVSFAVTGGDGMYSSDQGSLDSANFTSIAFACGTGFAVTVADGSSNSVDVSGDAPCDAPVGCEVDGGSVSFADGSSSMLICSGDGTGDVMNFATTSATAGYSYVITTPDGSVLDIATGSSNDFEGAPAGVCYVYGVAHEGALNAPNGSNIADIASNNDCAEVSSNFAEVTRIAALDVVTSVDCDNVEGTFTVNVTITGGLPAADPSFDYAVSGDFNGSSSSFTLGPLTDGEGYTIIVSDGFCGDFSVEEASIACTKCGEYSAGTMDGPSSISLCGGQGFTVSASGVELGGGEEGEAPGVLVYAVHTGSGDAAGSICATSLTGTFTSTDLEGCAAADGPWFVSAVVAPLDDAGNLDVASECTVVAPGIPLDFSGAVSIDFDEECDKTLGESTFTFTIMGGVAPYSISGNFTDAASDGNNITFTAGDGTAWSINVTDSNGCTATVGGTVVCVKDTAVEWLSFDGEVQSDGNLLKWVTANEIDNDYFTVERSLDGVTFESLETVEGAGTVYDARSYSFLDKTASAGINYYRVTQFDFDGTNSSTEVISLTRGEVTFGIGSISPVPAINNVDVAFNVERNVTVQLSIYDLTGKLILKEIVDANAGVNNHSIDVSTYAAGMYFISLNNGTTEVTDRFIK